MNSPKCHRGQVNRVLAELIRRGDGVLIRREAVRAVPVHVIEYAIRAGQLVPVYPGVFVPAGQPIDVALRHRAALGYAGPGAALSHISALLASRSSGSPTIG